MKFNPEDGQLTGPRCRNCHKGSSGCGACHNTDPLKDGVNSDDPDADAWAADNSRASITHLFAAMFDMIGFPTGYADVEDVETGPAAITAYRTMYTSNGLLNAVTADNTTTTTSISPVVIADQIKSSRAVSWSTDWRTTTSALTVDQIKALCSDDGLSFPHRTLGWKMLKDDLFGIDIGDPDGDGTGDSDLVAAGDARQGTIGNGLEAHDLDSVCLDCHNPTIWNASSSSDHTDGAGSADDADDDLLLRGLP